MVLSLTKLAAAAARLSCIVSRWECRIGQEDFYARGSVLLHSNCSVLHKCRQLPLVPLVRLVFLKKKGGNKKLLSFNQFECTAGCFTKLLKTHEVISLCSAFECAAARTRLQRPWCDPDRLGLFSPLTVCVYQTLAWD